MSLCLAAAAQPPAAAEGDVGAAAAAHPAAAARVAAAARSPREQEQQILGPLNCIQRGTQGQPVCPSGTRCAPEGKKIRKQRKTSKRVGLQLVKATTDCAYTRERKNNKLTVHRPCRVPRITGSLSTWYCFRRGFPMCSIQNLSVHCNACGLLRCLYTPTHAFCSAGLCKVQNRASLL